MNISVKFGTFNVVEKKKTNQDLRTAKKLKGVYKHCINILSSSPNARHIVKDIEAKMKGI